MNSDSESIMKTSHKILTLLAVTLLFSCTALDKPRSSPDSQQISTRMLLDNSPLMKGVEPLDLSQIDVLGLSPQMIDFLDRWVDIHQRDYFKLRGLLYAVMGDGTFEVIYDDTTRTAQETFLDQRGNCLSFTSMFVAMARYLGLDANFQEVMIPPSWSAEGETFILSQHIDVHVNINSGQDMVVDFNRYDFRTSDDMQVVSDDRGRAHYFNNIGVEHMLDGDIPVAFANFRQGLREDMSYSPVWINLGTLYNREGYPRYAETAYLKALDTDKSNIVALSNLAGLYEQQGQSELVAQYQRRIETHRMQNPYYRYHLARTAFDDGDYTTAISHLKYAVRKNKYDDSFYFLMSLSYLKSGEKEEAQYWMKKAEEFADKDADKKRYHNKFDLLIRSGTGQ
jgi:tetratricopeptide (TPR) repeat protein